MTRNSIESCLPEESESFLNRVLGLTGDERAARAAKNTPIDGGALVVEPIGSFDVPVSNPEDVEEVMRIMMEQARVELGLDTISDQA